MIGKFVGILFVLIVSAVLVSCRSTSYSDAPDVMCRLPEMKGHCRALIMRWRYDPNTGKCYEFGFGGCDGNSNNFPTRKACMDMCSAIR
ncbi:hypothetical protein GWI33_017410 [Rhynchophorus ferrugineus]|uniref:BPTI/Kunitz inhibitor domain-containing protein n=1 Tax=Rhynchophorus ferrugineus TaxID=354439 RepID=A0A834IRY0_RHYFE|nr:hypothetical protein GWI33_017410 [Rhynchophorus ferrugineus]